MNISGPLKNIMQTILVFCWQRLGSLMHRLRLSHHVLYVLRLMCATGGAEAKRKIHSVFVWFTYYELYKGFVKEPLQDPRSCLQHKSVHVSISKCDVQSVPALHVKCWHVNALTVSMLMLACYLCIYAASRIRYHSIPLRLFDQVKIAPQVF